MIRFREKSYGVPVALAAAGAVASIGGVGISAWQGRQANKQQEEANKQQTQIMRMQAKEQAKQMQAQTQAIQTAAAKNPGAVGGMAQQANQSMGQAMGTQPQQSTFSAFSVAGDLAKDAGKLLWRNKRKFATPALLAATGVGVAYGVDKAIQAHSNATGQKIVNPESQPHYDENGNLVQPKPRMSTKKKLLLGGGALLAGTAGAYGLHKAGVVNMKPAWDLTKKAGGVVGNHLKGMGAMGWAMAAAPAVGYAVNRYAQHKAKKELVNEVTNQQQQPVQPQQPVQQQVRQYSVAPVVAQPQPQAVQQPGQNPQQPVQPQKKKWSLKKKLLVGGAAVAGLGLAYGLKTGAVQNGLRTAGRQIRGGVIAGKRAAIHTWHDIKSGDITDNGLLGHGGFGGKTAMTNLSNQMQGSDMSNATKSVGEFIGRHKKAFAYGSIPVGIYALKKLNQAGTKVATKGLETIDNNAFAYQKSQQAQVPEGDEYDEEEYEEGGQQA